VPDTPYDPLPAMRADRDELFFWEQEWQADEAESLEARRRGELRTFDTGRDAVRWLLQKPGDPPE
jgi:hypothetical protein